MSTIQIGGRYGADTRRPGIGAWKLLIAAFLAGCGAEPPSTAVSVSLPVAARAGVQRTLALGAYTTPREAYGKSILPAFREHWKQKTGEDVKFEESYLGSGAQSRAIIAGFEADIAALSLEPDIQKIVDAGLIRNDWKQGPNAGMVTRSIVVIGVRPGNPKKIQGWGDLARGDVDLLTPNVKTSGGAMWNVLAIVGAVGRGRVEGASDPAAFLAGVLGRVRVMDKGARESMISFEQGLGDAILTYENEVLVAQQAGQAYDYVVPASTILIENPIAVVDEWAKKHGNEDIAAEFVRFVLAPEAQRAFAQHGLRPVDEKVAQETAKGRPIPADLFTISDLGGWKAAQESTFEPGGAFERALILQKGN